MRFLIFALFFHSFNVLQGQPTSDDNIVLWSATRKLTVDDFGIKTRNSETNPSLAQFTVDYRVGGFAFMTKNFNNKVRNYLIKSASSIDTSLDVSVTLRYQQTLFDICEICTRQFRKALKDHRKKIASNPHFVDSLNQKAMTDFANRRVLYDKETNFGTRVDQQMSWEATIQKELNDLLEFERKADQ